MSTVLFLTLLLQQQQPPPTGAPQANAVKPRIEWSQLPPEFPSWLRDSVRFGYLEVPQDHAAPSGPRYRIAIAVLPARAGTPTPDPVVYVPGGPGSAAIKLNTDDFARSREWDLYRERRDVVILDPRGHGYSDPQTCMEGASAEPPPGGTVAQDQRFLEQLAECRTRLVAEGARLETLSAVQVAHDLEWLRQALGAPQLNLYGASYGTRLAAEAMRQVPSTIRAVHLSGPVPAGYFRGEPTIKDGEEVLDTLFRRCAEQPDCRTAFPQLKADYDSVVVRVRREPVRLTLPRRADRPEVEMVIGDSVVRIGLAQLSRTAALAARMPSIIHALAERPGDWPRMVRQLMERPGEYEGSTGTLLAFWCNDGVVSRSSPERLQQRCRTWLGDAWSGREAEPVRSDVPGLITNGEIDARTPPSYGRFLAAGLPRAYLTIVRVHGHERPPLCSFRISRDLFDAPDRKPDMACLDSIPPIKFVVGGGPIR